MHLMPTERRQWQEIASEFARYPQMTSQQRQHLVAETRRFLQQLQQEIQRRFAESEPLLSLLNSNPLERRP
jgi:ATP-dependent DNA helicase RecG